MKLTLHVYAAALALLGVNSGRPAPCAASQPSRPGDIGEALQPPETPASPALGMVLGKKLTIEDLRPPADTMERMAKSEKLKSADQWLQKHRGELMQRAVVAALAKRYVKDHHLEVTDAEIEEFDRHMSGSTAMEDALTSVAADLRKQLADPQLAETDRARLTEELAKREKSIKEEQTRREGADWPRESARAEMRARSAQMREQLKDKDLSPGERKEVEEELAHNLRFQDLTDEQAAKEWKKFTKEMKREVAEPFVQNWKINRELYKKYGGRILFQQAGIEPIDAMRKWLEEREKAGGFVIYDADLKEPFWRYYKQDHGSFILPNPTGHEFDKPWWVQKPER